MAHREVRIGKMREARKCQACGRTVAVGETAAHYPMRPRGTVHIACHWRERDAAWNGRLPGGSSNEDRPVGQLSIRGLE